MEADQDQQATRSNNRLVFRLAHDGNGVELIVEFEVVEVDVGVEGGAPGEAVGV